jgi:hypothetical protein
MSRFHLMHCVPHPRLHGLNGYLEVIQTLDWGLQQLGHQVSYALNRYDQTATNIIFGVQMLALDTLQALPASTIVYNMEQLRHLRPEHIESHVHLLAQRFRIWDYSAANLEVWRQLGACRVEELPIGYAPILSRIPRPAQQDIDVLIYGIASPKRLQAFQLLSMAGLTTVFVSGLYGEARDALIARSKTILNATLYERSQVFEIVRVSYLLANRKAVITVRDKDTYVEPDIAAAVRFTTLEQLVDECLELTTRAGPRAALETQGFEIMSRRDIRTFLGRIALGAP